MHSPNVQSDPRTDALLRLAHRFRQTSRVIALLVAALGLAVLGGWAFNVPALMYIRPTLQSMKVNTALSFLCLGAGLWLAHDDKRQRSRCILGLVVVIIAGMTLAEYALRTSLGIDQLLFRDSHTPSLSAYPGRMAIATALCFLFLGFAVAFLGTKKAIATQRALVAACFALSLVALCGYLYGANSLYSITSFSTMGLHTSAGLFAACLAYLLASPDEGIVSIAASNTNSGLLLRALLPPIIVVPILIGWLSLAGQRANLYDTPFGVALLVFGNIGFLTALTVLVARSMHRLECGRSRAEEARQSREELLKIFVKNVPAGVAMLDCEMRYLQVSDRWCADYNVDSSQVLGRSHYELFPDIPQHWKEVHRRGLAGETLRGEDRWDRESGTKRVRWEIRPWKRSGGGVGGILIFAEDITQRKQMEEALSGMTRKLVEAQEQERARIARELHDDIAQRLAMLAIEIEQTEDRRPEMPSQVRDRAQELSKSAKELSNDIQALSHELHSAKLDYLGVAGGMKSWCNEFGERRGMEIEFKSSGLTKSLAPEASLCLLRVLQEALHNAAKHSGVKRVDVQLLENSGEIQLIVSDSGKGFDVAATMQDRGLGVTSMQERVRLVGGTIAIDSKPLGGTTIRVRVPFAAERSSQVSSR